MTLKSFFDRYPRIQLADRSHQEAIFSIIDQTSISSDSLQVSFNRRPDFYAFLEAQGEKAFVFTFHNKDGIAHGFACLSFRRITLNGKNICLGYASDLRTTSALDREAWMQWRRMYAEVVQNIHLIEEFDGCIGIVTAVWNENKLAQKALVQKKRPSDFQYEPGDHYYSSSIWGRWNFFRSCPTGIRKIREEEISTLKKSLLTNTGLSWNEKDLLHSLSIFNKTFSDFYVLEQKDEIISFVLPATSPDSKHTVIKKWPPSLMWISRLLPFLGKRKILLDEPLHMLQLTLFKSLKGSAEKNLLQFIDYFWIQNNQQIPENQFSILTVNSWNKNLPGLLKRHGYLFTPIEGSLYKVTSDQTLPEFKELNDFTNLEIGFL